MHKKSSRIHDQTSDEPETSSKQNQSKKSSNESFESVNTVLDSGVNQNEAIANGDGIDQNETMLHIIDSID